MQPPTPEGYPRAYGTEAARPFGYGMGLLCGGGAAVVGAIGWYVIMDTTGWVLGLVAAVVGWLVGLAVFAVAGRRGDSPFKRIAAMLGGLVFLLDTAWYRSTIYGMCSTASARRTGRHG